jgi:hypothetical protein
MSAQELRLGDGVSLSYILRDGTQDTLESGKLESGRSGVNVYDENGKPIARLSGTEMCNWSVLAPNGQRVNGWYDVLNDAESAFVFGPPYPHPGPRPNRRK